jgi:hypothetical protein
MAGKLRASWIVMGFALLLCAGGIGFALQGLAQPGVDGPIANPIDFRAFYCGAAVAGAHGDPYQAAPMRSCEAAASLATGFAPAPNLPIQAPLPGYVFALLGPLAHLPILPASIIWFVLGFGAVLGAIALVARLTELPVLWIALAFVASSLMSLPLGQIVPFVVVALSACAYALRSGRPILAAVCAAAAMVEPHLGLPAALALFVWIPATRIPLFACAALLAGLSLAFIGIPANVEYFTVLLPAHAQHEVMWFAGQYSLSALLYHTGTPAARALQIGGLSYVAMLAIGVWLGRRCARAFDDPAFVPLIPVAFALLGGAFIHNHQMMAALPAAFLLFARVPAQRPLLRWALVLLAVPWDAIVRSHGIPEALGLFPEHDYTVTTLELLAIKAPTWLALGILVRATFLARSGERASRPRALREAATSR